MALNVSKGSNLDAGTVAEIAPLPVSFTIVQGVAQKVTRIPIYRIKLGNPQLIPNIRISVLNLADVGRVLNNPNAFVDVELWYPDKDASSNYLEIDDAKTPDNPQGKVIQDTGTEARLSRVSGDAALVPTVYNKQTLYVVVSITVPGGIPPGQQEQLSELKFFCDVRM
jgi:hypothetical protein